MKTLVYAHFFALSSAFCLFSSTFFAQCPSGSIGVTGTGCGCLSGCNLTSIGGPNCGGGVGGDCNAGQIAMSIDIPVPAGCTYTVTAAIMTRGASCSSSGGDNGDKVKVDIAGGGKTFQTGTANASLTDSYVQVGPGTIRISGTANRADERISYTTISSGASCVNCSSSLPAELLRFDAVTSGETVECSWETGSEVNVDFFTIERSSDGFTFEPMGAVEATGTTTEKHAYKLYDSSPVTIETSYYRLKQTDNDGTTVFSEIRSVRFGEASVSVFPNPSEGQLTIIGKHLDAKDIVLMNALGEPVQLTAMESENEVLFQLSGLPEGLYLILYPVNGELRSEKIVVTNR
jgi:hypothetical protein